MPPKNIAFKKIKEFLNRASYFKEKEVLFNAIKYLSIKVFSMTVITELD